MITVHPTERRRIATMDPSIRLRLNRLERPMPWPAEVQDEMQRALTAVRPERYPSYPAFYDTLQHFAGVPSSQLVAGAGAEDIIRTLFMLHAGGRIAVLWPCCRMFEVYAQAFGVTLQKIATAPRMEWKNVEELFDALHPETDVFLLVNPGQPVNTLYVPNEIRALHELCFNAGIWLVVDEAYYGFQAPTCINLVTEVATDLTVIRSFSKAFGLAGARLGFAASTPDKQSILNSARASGEVSAHAMALGTLLMDRWAEFVRPGCLEIARARDWLRATVRDRLAIPCWGRWANFVLIETAGPADLVAERLAGYGIAVNASLPEPLHRHFILVTCGDLPMMHEFYDAFRTAYEASVASS